VSSENIILVLTKYDDVRWESKKEDELETIAKKLEIKKILKWSSYESKYENRKLTNEQLSDQKR